VGFFFGITTGALMCRNVYTKLANKNPLLLGDKKRTLRHEHSGTLILYFFDGLPLWHDRL